MAKFDNHPITTTDMVDFMQRATSSRNSSILSALSYYGTVKANFEFAIAQRPEIQAELARNALEAAILGMRRTVPCRPVRIRNEGFWSRMMRRFGKEDRLHPMFHNEAFGVYLSCLFDAIHNLPSLMVVPSASACTFPDPAKEIAWALACLRLIPTTHVAVDLRFESIFMAREHQSHGAGI